MDDQVQLPFRQALPVGEQVPLHGLHRRGCAGQSSARILFQIAEGFRAFFHAGDLRVRAEALDPQPQTAGAGTQIQHTGRFYARKGLCSGLGHHLGIRTGAEYARPHDQFKVQKAPVTAQVLQRLPRLPAQAEGLQPGSLRFGQWRVRQPDIPPGHQPEKFCGVVIRIQASGRRQTGFQLPHRVPRVIPVTICLPPGFRQHRGHGRNGHLDHAVIRLKHREVLHPDAGLTMMRVARLSDRPHHEQLVADAHDQRQQQQLEEHPQADAAPGQHAVQEYAHDDHQDQEAGAAARWKRVYLRTFSTVRGSPAS